MDPIKQSLIEAAGDLDKSVQNVQANVRNQLHKQKKAWPHFVPITVIALVALLALVFTLPLKNNEPSIVSSSYTQKEELQFLYEMMQQSSSTHPEKLKLEFTAGVAYPYYAEKLKVQIDEHDLQHYIQVESMESIDSESMNMLKDDPNYDKIVSIYIPHFSKAEYYQPVLLDKYREMYPTFNTSTLLLQLQYDAVNYFHKFTSAASAFAPTSFYKDLVRTIDGSVKGTVVEVTKHSVAIALDVNYFDIMELTVDQIASFKTVVKFPMQNADYIPGELVEIAYLNELDFTESEVNEVVFNQFGSTSLYNATFTISDDSQAAFSNIMNSLDWVPFEKNYLDRQDFNFYCNGEWYTIHFANKEFTIYHDSQKAIVPEALSEELLEIIRKPLPDLD